MTPAEARAAILSLLAHGPVPALAVCERVAGPSGVLTRAQLALEADGGVVSQWDDRRPSGHRRLLALPSQKRSA